MKIQHITLNELLDPGILADTRRRDFQRYKQTMAQAGQKLDANTFKQAMDKIFASAGKQFTLPMPTNFSTDKEALDWINKASALYVQGTLFAEPAPVQKQRSGGKVAGQTSQTPGAIRKRQQRAAQKNTPAQSQVPVQTAPTATTTPTAPVPAPAPASTLATQQLQQQQAVQQMKATAQANQSAVIRDSEIKAAADAAKAKPAFQQTLADKLAIKQAAARGIRETLENDLFEFERFLSMPGSIAQPSTPEIKPEPVAEPKPQGNEVLELWTKLKV